LDAEHLAEEARAALGAAQSRLDQFRRVERTAGRAESTVQLRSPLSGTITRIDVAPGAFVEAGVSLWRVTDLTQLWLEAYVPEFDATRLPAAGAVSFTVDGSAERIELAEDNLVAISRVIDPQARTLSVLYALDNAGARFAVGAYCRVYLVNGPERTVVAVPEAALVDDSGVSVAFVQTEGESFERRPVRLGIRDAGFVEVVQGLSAGEHVVTRGAWSVKLAASSGAVPAHGHSH
jgi:RND family efflux transporter MFP subunit